MPFLSSTLVGKLSRPNYHEETLAPSNFIMMQSVCEIRIGSCDIIDLRPDEPGRRSLILEEDMDRIAVIDGNSLINRAYYAMRNPMITHDGTYTHGIFGFLNMLEKLRKDYEPTHMVVAFDKKGPTFRHEQFEEYKAGRRKMPPELAMQIPLLKDILDAMHITRMEIDGFEADDIIGTVSRIAEEDGIEAVIFTGDKDQLQLASDTTRVVFTKKGVSEFDIYDREAFIEKYGFTPLQFIDFKGLAGDKSDNIPGIPGVGDKTATKLIA